MDLVVRSLGELGSLFTDDFHVVLGAWFLLDEDIIRDRSNNRFSYKDGKRPVVVFSVSGPNTMAFPRTTSDSDGIAHSIHHHAGNCCIDQDGKVVDNFVCTIVTSDCSADSYSCLEPNESKLVQILERGGRR